MTSEQLQWEPIAQYTSHYMGFPDQRMEPFHVLHSDIQDLLAYYDESNGAGSYQIWNNMVELRREYPRAYITQTGRVIVPEMYQD